MSRVDGPIWRLAKDSMGGRTSCSRSWRLHADTERALCAATSLGKSLVARKAMGKARTTLQYSTLLQIKDLSVFRVDVTLLQSCPPLTSFSLGWFLLCRQVSRFDKGSEFFLHAERYP